MLAEKDEELRRMQEMLAQMQVGSGTWPLVIVPFLEPSATCVYPRLRPPYLKSNLPGVWFVIVGCGPCLGKSGFLSALGWMMSWTAFLPGNNSSTFKFFSLLGTNQATEFNKPLEPLLSIHAEEEDQVFVYLYNVHKSRRSILYGCFPVKISIWETYCIHIVWDDNRPKICCQILPPCTMWSTLYFSTLQTSTKSKNNLWQWSDILPMTFPLK